MSTTEPQEQYDISHGSVITGDSLAVLPELPENEFHAIVSDPPYNFNGGFEQSDWDNIGSAKEYQEWCQEWAERALTTLKPGGHLIAFSGNRSHHRLFSGIEDAGFEIRDTINWIYATGIPKGQRIERWLDDEFKDEFGDWRSMLKPTTEYAVLARAPMSERSSTKNQMEHGTANLNVEACRLDGDDGRFPVNMILDPVMADVMDLQSGQRQGCQPHTVDDSGSRNILDGGGFGATGERTEGYNDSGGASRFFKQVSWDGVAKVTSTERTNEKTDCQLCKRTIATSAVKNTKPTHQKEKSSAHTNVTPTVDEQGTTSKHSNVSSAEKNSKTGQVKNESTAQNNAQENPNKFEKQSNVNTAETSSRPNQATNENTVQDPVHQKTTTSNTSKQTGTTTTSNENVESSKNDTKTTQSSERKQKQEQKQDENTQKASPVRNVEIPMQIGTTTTTINLQTCAGCAEAVTSNTTKTNTGRGGKVSPSRFIYCPKASQSERTHDGRIENNHKTVKPLQLMRWLVRLVTAEGQKVLDPFAGSGSTIVAAEQEGRECVGIEMDPDFAQIARDRFADVVDQP